MTSKGYTKGWLQIHPKTCKVTSQLQHKASKMLLCIQIGIGKMGKMTTNRKHTKTQKLMRTQNRTDTQNDFTDKTAKRCKRP